LAHIQNDHSCRKIAELLTEMGMSASHTTVAKVKKQAEAERLGVMCHGLWLAAAIASSCSLINRDMVSRCCPYLDFFFFSEEF
jgi:dihydroxyacetone kinase